MIFQCFRSTLFTAFRFAALMAAFSFNGFAEAADIDDKTKEAIIRAFLSEQEQSPLGIPSNAAITFWPYRTDAFGPHWHVAWAETDPKTGAILEPHVFVGYYQQYRNHNHTPGEAVSSSALRTYPKNMQEDLRVFRKNVDALERNPRSFIEAPEVKEFVASLRKLQALRENDPFPAEAFNADIKRLGFILLNMFEQPSEIMKAYSMYFLGALPACIPQEYASRILIDFRRALLAEGKKTNLTTNFQEHVVTFFRNYFHHLFRDFTRWQGGFSENQKARVVSQLRVVKETIEISSVDSRLPLPVQALGEESVKYVNDRIKLFQCESLLTAKSSADLN